MNEALFYLRFKKMTKIVDYDIIKKSLGEVL